VGRNWVGDGGGGGAGGVALWVHPVVRRVGRDLEGNKRGGGGKRKKEIYGKRSQKWEKSLFKQAHPGAQKKGGKPKHAKKHKKGEKGQLGIPPSKPRSGNRPFGAIEKRPAGGFNAVAKPKT